MGRRKPADKGAILRAALGLGAGCLVLAVTLVVAKGADRGEEGRAAPGREAAGREEPRRDGESTGMPSDFRPQTDREATLLRIVMELRREMAELRREIEQLREAELSDGTPSRPEGPRDGERPTYGASRDGETPSREATPGNQRNQFVRLFARYDANRDGKVTYQEFLAMREGPETPQIRQIFAAGDSNQDGIWSQEEFLAAAIRRQREAEAAGKDAPREGDRPVRREGDREGG